MPSKNQNVKQLASLLLKDKDYQYLRTVEFKNIGLIYAHTRGSIAGSAYKGDDEHFIKAFCDGLSNIPAELIDDDLGTLKPKELNACKNYIIATLFIGACLDKFVGSCLASGKDFSGFEITNSTDYVDGDGVLVWMQLAGSKYKAIFWVGMPNCMTKSITIASYKDLSGIKDFVNNTEVELAVAEAGTAGKHVVRKLKLSQFSDLPNQLRFLANQYRRKFGV